MTRDELIELARKIRNAEGNNEEDIDGNIDLFLKKMFLILMQRGIFLVRNSKA